MEKLFLDNFRGFSNEFIEIRDVNFLVGENSSGKSSVLMAINTILSPGFWFNLDFHAGEAQMYSFEDLVSVEQKDKSNFKIGLFHNSDKDTSFLFEFTNDNGKPVISSGIIEKDRKLFIFYCEEEYVRYKVIINERLSLDHHKQLTKKEVSQLEGMQLKMNIIPPITLLQICEHIISNKKNNSQVELPIWNITSIAPIRSKPKKTYDEPGTLENPEGDHIPYVIRRIKKTKSNFFQKIDYFGEQSGLFKNIDIKEYDDADDAPFRVNFVLKNEPLNIVNIGYGVSQVLPILFNLYTQNSTFITIQQPEVHLHPKAQAAIGNIFFDLSVGEKRKKFIIETHSDYIIDRFRQKQKKAQEKPNVHVLFFLREDGRNKTFSINIDDNGNYDNNQPREFREFFINEELENLGLQQ